MYGENRNQSRDRALIRWIQTPIRGTFLTRETRFSARVQVNEDGVHLAYVPNSSRLEDLLVPGRAVILEPRTGPSRKTRYDLKAVDLGDFVVSIDARIPNLVVHWWLPLGILPGLNGYHIKKAEYAYKGSRIDFLLEGPKGSLLLETKSCTLAKDGVALFPDAPTSRGIRHLKALARFRRQGNRAVVLWVVQRPDAQALRPFAEMDPEFTKTARWAQIQGVEFYAIRLRLTPITLEFDQEIPVLLEA